LNEHPAAEPLTSNRPFLSGSTRARVATILLGLCIAVNVASLFSAYLQIDFISRVQAGEELTPEDAEANDARETLVAVLWLAVFIATAIAFLVWVHRAYRNLEALGNKKSQLEFSPGWAVGWYFIPLANIVYPFKAMREIWQKSDPGVRSDDDLAWQRTDYTPPVVLAWWIVWLTSGVASRLLNRFANDAQTADSMLWVTKFSIGVDLLAIVSAVLAILVVQGINKRQEERIRHVRYVESTPPPPTLYTQTAGDAPAQR